MNEPTVSLLDPVERRGGDPVASSNRSFGLVLGGAFVLLGLFFSAPWNMALFSLGGLLFVSGLILPRLLRLPNLGWSRLGNALGLIAEIVVVGTIYFAVVLPLGLGWRVFRRDPLSQRFDPIADSYWRDDRTTPPTDLERQF
jgi:hypothetical protein